MNKSKIVFYIFSMFLLVSVSIIIINFNRNINGATVEIRVDEGCLEDISDIELIFYPKLTANMEWEGHLSLKDSKINGSLIIWEMSLYGHR